ncbi:hypothetical protein FOL46_007354 [Perkinsus olseni]|uniref:Uncharacterized protein n=3 Tax=Perkinsus olseni TaxID=32597 RepID=A0A7J6LED5_PEROL|nr:hypothetical protein FOL46_007354 [Perkinsus olseni]
MAQEGDTPSPSAAAAPSAYRTLLKYAREYTHSKNGESKHPIGLMMCGLNAGLMQSLIFNPYDRALYLTIKHSKDTSGYHRRFLDRRNWPRRPGQYFEGVGPAVLQKAVSFGLYFPMEELFLSSPLVEQAGGAWLAGTLAGLANGIFTTPFNAVKFSIWRTSQQQYSNPVTAINVLKDIQGREGLRGLFRGCVPTVYRDVTFCLTYATMRHVHSNDPQAGGFLGNMASAIVATALSSPFNWVRLQEYSHPEVSRRTSQWLRILLQSEGLIGPGPSLGDGFLASSKELCRRLGSLLRTLRIGWGSVRVGLGMGFGSQVYAFCRHGIAYYDQPSLTMEVDEGESASSEVPTRRRRAQQRRGRSTSGPDDPYAASPPSSPFSRIPTEQLILMIATQMPSFALAPEASSRSRLLLMPAMDLQDMADAVVRNNMCEFCWSLCFHPAFLSRLFYEGFLPICTDIGGTDEDGSASPLYILLPKLHRKRSAITDILRDLHIHKKVRKKAGRYELSFDTDFDGVVSSCHRQHGEAWLYPPIVNSLRAIHGQGQGSGGGSSPREAPSVKRRNGGSGPAVSESSTSSSSQSPTARSSAGGGRVSLHSVEVRRADTKELVAGELGCLVGKCYTSLTGFFDSKSPGSGSVQMAALGAYLSNEGLAQMWDIGMDIEYKRSLGARNLPRTEFVRTFRHLRDESSQTGARCAAKNCREIIDTFLLARRRRQTEGVAD